MLVSISIAVVALLCAGLVYQPPLPTGQLRAVRTNDRSMTGCGRYVDALKQLAGTYWGLTRHPGWTLAPETPVSDNSLGFRVFRGCSEHHTPCSLIS